MSHASCLICISLHKAQLLNFISGLHGIKVRDSVTKSLDIKYWKSTAENNWKDAKNDGMQFLSRDLRARKLALCSDASYFIRSNLRTDPCDSVSAAAWSAIPVSPWYLVFSFPGQVGAACLYISVAPVLVVITSWFARITSKSILCCRSAIRGGDGEGEK